MITHCSVDHCRGGYMREFAHKTIKGMDIPNKDGYLPELRRIRSNPIKDDVILSKVVNRYRNRPGEYITVYSYESLNDRGVIDYTSAKINRIYLDFDHAEEPQKALNDAILTIKSLIKSNIFPHCYFSGNKGIALYIEFVTVDIKPENKKEVLALFFDLVEERIQEDHNVKCGTLDHQVRGDIARVSRLPNSRHKSGLYCIPLTFGDMYKGIDHIKILAKEPREFDLERVIVYTMMRNETMPKIIKNLEKQVIANRQTAVKEKEMKTRARELQKIKRPEMKGRITDEDIERAKNVPLSSFVGHDKKVICPFHNDGDPSLSIDHTKNVWHCFGCGAGGSPIDFIMKSKGLDFINAVKELVEA